MLGDIFAETFARGIQISKVVPEMSHDYRERVRDRERSSSAIHTMSS